MATSVGQTLPTNLFQVYLKIKIMERITVEQVVYQDYYYDEKKSIEEFMQLLNDAVEKGATHIEIDSEYESSSVNLRLYFERPENDLEYNGRVEYENQRVKDNEDRERKEFERLSKKFNS